MSTERYLTDRTTIETDWECGHKLFWYKHFGERGIVPAIEAIYFKDGRDIHSLLAEMAAAENPVGYVRSQYEADTSEPTDSKMRCYGWAFAWAMFVEPRIRAQFETVHLEQELVLQRDPLWIVTTPDRVLRDRTSGQVVVDDYKTTSMAMGWATYWPFAVQIHIQLKAVEEELGIKPTYGRVRGLVKGQVTKGRLSHPYVNAWLSSTGEWTPEYRSGLTSVPVASYPRGLEAWVQQCGEEVAFAQFPLSQPVFLNERLLDDMLARRVRREREIAASKDACQTDLRLRAEIFEQRFSKCRPIGRSGACPYIAACHNASINENPIGSGLYLPRTPHHELELIGVDDEADSGLAVSD